MRRHFVHFLWGFLIVLLGSISVFFVSVWNGWVGYMPDMEELSDPIDKFASQVYSSDQQLIGTWNQDNNNRVAIDYNGLSPHLVHALVATEDERFYEHSGIDFIALGRAIVKRGASGECGRWFDHHTAAGKAALLRESAQYTGTSLAETY